jgi:hypothetical protein
MGANFTNEDGVDSAILTDSDLRGAKYTDESTSMLFLELVHARGLESARFSPHVLEDYLEKAFRCAHHPEIGRSPDFFQELLDDAIRSISVLLTLCKNHTPPNNLVEAAQSINAELIVHLSRHPNELYKLKSRHFEELIAEILSSFGWRVDLTQTTRDGGYDIFAISTDKMAGVETSWIIECKKFAPTRKVGIDYVRALYGVKTEHQVPNMMLATTSYFTKDVHSYKASRYDLTLRDYEGILEWLNTYRPNPNGRLYLKDNRLYRG